jgi:hypothetical protein
VKTVIVHLHIYSQLPMRTSAGTAYSSRLHVFTQVDCRVRSIFSFLCNVLWIILCLVVLLFCLSIDLRLPITPSNLFTIGVSVHRVTASDYPFQFVYHWSVCPSSYGFRLPLPICLPLECLSFDYPFQFVYHWSVCPSSYGFSLPLWYFLLIFILTL